MDFKEALWLQGLKQGWVMRFRPQGGSMIPFLRQGDTVSICPGKSCRPGDIILWQAGDALVLHRVVVKKNGWLITKGDSLGRLDSPVPQEQILGRAVARERDGRLCPLNIFMQRWLGLAFSLTVPLVPGLMSLLRTVNRKLQAFRERPSAAAYQKLLG